MALVARAQGWGGVRSPGLSLKVVITTGPARRLVVGDPDIQLIDSLAGRTIARLATGDRMIQKGEKLLDDATYKCLGESATINGQRIETGTSETFMVLESLANPADQVYRSPLGPEEVTAEILRPWLLEAVYQREHTGLIYFLTELRPAVPVFVNFSGIDYDGDSEAGEKLNAFIAHAQRVVAKYDGALLQLVIGDKGSYIYAVFGAITAHEDDAQRAVHAALEIKQIPRQLTYIRSIQTGISLGTLRVGAY